MLSAEQYDAQRLDLPEGGRWTELHAGEVVTLSPPDDDHGTVVLNLSKAIAATVTPGGGIYACFDLGLIVQRNPDTVWFPAICLFAHGPAFAESDKVVSETSPALVVEIASTPDRRRQLADRIARWLNWGVSEVVVFDTRAKLVQRHPAGTAPTTLKLNDVFQGQPLLPSLKINVADVFKPPTWWKK